MNQPISSGSFDPLTPPGGQIGGSTAPEATFAAGEFARTSMDNSAFFINKPKGNAEADRLLGRGTSMKVISTSGSYVKVELDSGEVGYVPAVMLENPNASTLPVTQPGEFQVYPPIDGFGAVTPLDPINPAELPPGGAIPTVIDPDAPSTLPATPDIFPTTPDTLPAMPESTPLPPNDEDLKAMEEAKKAAAEAAQPKLEE
ncbi:MAG: hypothetical protein Q7R22_007010 [Verrucomicrobiota bacterium JB025]|nr:hypothetical protein [Verrucomicrobiota bacterium JB025]